MDSGFANTAAKAFADAREALLKQSQLPQLPLPKLQPSDNPLSSPLNALKKIHLPERPVTLDGIKLPSSLPELPFFGNSVDLGEMTSQLAKATQKVASDLPLLLEEYVQLTNQASRSTAEALAEASVRISESLKALFATNMALDPAVGHLQSLLGHAVEQAYAAGATLLSEQYQPLVVTIMAGAASTVLGMSLAAAREDAQRSTGEKNYNWRLLALFELPLDYDMAAITWYYNFRFLTVLKRMAEVYFGLGEFLLDWEAACEIETDEEQAMKLNSRAVTLRNFLQEAGPTFTKAGQIESTQSSEYPAVVVEQLKKLQDEVLISIDSINITLVLL